MRSDNKRLGDFIRKVNVRNTELDVTKLMGINIDKFFMPSVANTIGTDMSKYRIVKKGQFACNRMHVGRDKRLPVALLTEEDIIVSPAYDVFEIIDQEVLNPKYLMMWFLREEFDRNVWFYTDADVRGGLKWEDFCNIMLPVPPITKQNELVEEYNILLKKVNLNNCIIQKIEETIETIYKRWFIDFEFPNNNGKPYKSSGGEMEFSSVLNSDIPKGWDVKSFTEVVEFGGGGTPDTTNETYWNGGIPFFTPGDISRNYYCLETEKSVTKLGLQNSSTKLYPKNTVFVTARGTVGAIALAGTDMTMNQSCYALMGENQFYVHQLTISTIKSLKNQASGAVFNALVIKDFAEKYVVQPPKDIETNFQSKVHNLYNAIYYKVKQNELLNSTLKLLLSKLAKGGGN